MNRKLTNEVIARLTVTRQDNTRTIVEIHEGATFHCFYTFFRQQGARRSTKTFVRTAGWNEYLPVINTHLHRPGLDVIEKHLRSLFATTNPAVKVTLRIIRKRAYKRLINAAPDTLGLARAGANIQRHVPMQYPVIIGKAIPVGKWLKSLQQGVPS